MGKLITPSTLIIALGVGVLIFGKNKPLDITSGDDISMKNVGLGLIAVGTVSLFVK
jgi:hypothetical protein